MAKETGSHGSHETAVWETEQQSDKKGGNQAAHNAHD